MLKLRRTLLVCCLLLNGVFAQAAQLNVATSEWVPYVGKELPRQGLAIDIVNTALQRAGYKPVVTIQAWSRTLEGVDVGVFDLIAAAWYSKEREEHFTFSKPYIYNEIKLVARADSGFTFDSIADLNGRMVGVIRNYAYGDVFSNAPGVLRVPGTHVLQNILRVLSGELELTLDDERVLKYELRHNMSANREKLKILPRSVSRNGLHIAISKQNPKHKEIGQAFDRAVAAMKKDGTYDRIVRAHAND